MGFETPLTTLWFKKHEIVDEDAVTLRLRPLRWRDRVLYDVLRWSGAGAAVAVVVGSLLLYAGPSEAARVEAQVRPIEPETSRLIDATPVLASAQFDLELPSPAPEPEEEIIIIIEDEEEDEEILIFDDALDAPSAAAMAEVHIELGEHALALQYALEATEAAPRNPSHQALLGEAYLLTGDRKAARRAFRRSRRLRR